MEGNIKVPRFYIFPKRQPTGDILRVNFIKKNKEQN